MNTELAPSAVIVLAAGAGTRMKSATPKVMHGIGGRSMVEHAVAAARDLNPERLAVVVRHQRDKVAEHVLTFDPEVTIVDQDETPGTGRAVEVGLNALDAQAPVSGTVLVTYGDVPLLRPETLRELIAFHEEDKNSVTVLTTHIDEPGAYGRIVRNQAGEVTAIVEAKDRVQLAQLGRMLNNRILETHMRNGVTVVDTENTWVDVTVTIENDVTLLPGVQLHGSTTVATGATIGPDTTLTDMTVEAGATVIRAHGHGAVIGKGATVGPFAYLRPGTTLGKDAKLGTFCEAKNSQIGDSAKIPHLSYVGDATIGEGANIGAGSIFANYNGLVKSRSVIGAHARMGAAGIYVAPVTVGDGAYSGAGALIRKDVPAGALAYSETSQRTIEGWVLKNRAGTEPAEAAKAAGAQEPAES